MAQCLQSEMQVEDALEEATHNERHGTDFEQIPSADLFYVDKVTPVFRACALYICLTTAMATRNGPQHEHEHSGWMAQGKAKDAAVTDAEAPASQRKPRKVLKSEAVISVRMRDASRTAAFLAGALCVPYHAMLACASALLSSINMQISGCRRVTPQSRCLASAERRRRRQSGRPPSSDSHSRAPQ